MKKRENFPPKKFRGDFFRGVVYRGTCVGGMLGNKRQDRGKKNFRGPEILGGNFWGKCKKRVEKLFRGSVGGAVNPKNFRGEFFEKCQRKKFRGEILGGSTKGRAMR